MSDPSSLAPNNVDLVAAAAPPADSPPAGAHAHGSGRHAHQFEDMPQQKEADALGMWLFLATEVMLFGAIFAAYTVYRRAYYESFAEGSHELYFWLGTLNTVVLLTSSFFVVLAVHTARLGDGKATARWLLWTIAMGGVFLGVKAVEYSIDYKEGLIPFFGWWNNAEHPDQQMKLFFVFYFFATGLHALHMIIGMCVVAGIAWKAHLGKYDKEYHAPVEIVGLYWHFVDIVWVFLLPTLYMVSPHV